jgi:hypothetical protein
MTYYATDSAVPSFMYNMYYAQMQTTSFVYIFLAMFVLLSNFN